MKEINRNSLSVFLAQIPANIFGILVGIIISRVLGADGRGIYFLFQANAQFLTLLFGFGIGATLTYFISTKSIEFRKLLGIAFILLLFSLLFGILTIIAVNSFGISAVIPSGFNSYWYLFYLLGIFLLQLIVACVGGVLAGFKKFHVSSRLSVINSTINVLFFAILFWYHLSVIPIGINAVFIVSFFVQLINTLIWFLFSAEHLKTPLFKVSKEIVEFLKYGLTGNLSEVINFFNYRFDLYVIAYYLDNASVGIYSLSVSFGQFVWLISTPLSAVLLPYFTSTNDKPSRQKLLISYARLNFSLLVISGIGLFALSSLLPVIYGHEFAASILPFRILIIGTIIAGITKPFSSFLASRNLVSLNLKATMAGLIVTVILDIILIPEIGIIGASIASVLTYLVIFAVVYISGVTKNEFQLHNYFILRFSDIDFFRNKLTNNGVK